MQSPDFITSLAMAVTTATGVFLATLGAAALAAPSKATRFLLGFAATPVRHYIELALRMTVGLALLVASPRLPASIAFTIAGTVLVVTTVILAALPYRIHAEFARNAVPKALAFLPFIGAVSLVLGITITWATRVAQFA